MEHATALVDHDATPRTFSPHGTPLCTHCGFVCGCQRLVDAGWTVKCHACGRGLDRAPEAGDLVATVHQVGEHTCGGCEACMADFAVDAESAIEDYDRERDDELLDDAERRVA